MFEENLCPPQRYLLLLSLLLPLLIFLKIGLLVEA